MSTGNEDYDAPRDERVDRMDDGFDRERDDIAYAKQRVKAPAVTMLVFACISLVMTPLSLINYFRLPDIIAQQREQIDNNPGMQANQKQQMKDFWDMYEKVLLAVLPFTIGLQVIFGTLSVIGSLKMLRLSSRGWAMATSIINIVSIGHGCCFLTLPIGIWALIVVMNNRVTRGFREAARARQARVEY